MQRVTYVTAAATPMKLHHRQASSPSQSSFLSSSVLRPAAGTSWTRHEATPGWTMASAHFGGGVDLSGVGGSGCGGSSNSGWRNRRTFFVATTAGNDGAGQDGEAAAAAETEAAATVTTGGAGPGRAEATSVVGERSDKISTRGAGGEEHQEAKPPKKPRKRRQAAQTKYPFGKPLSVLASASTGFGAGSDAFFDIEDELPDLSVVEVAGHGHERAAMGTKELRERMAACPEVVVALSRGLAEGRARLVADNLCAYASTKRTAESTLAQLERLLGRRPDQVEWAMPLIRAHLTDESRPSWETHREQLSWVREMNIKEVGLEDMAESMLRAYARHQWDPDMTREKLRNEHPERWREAMTLSEKLADRLPVCRYQLVWRTLCKFLEAEKTRRRHRVLGELATVLRTWTHLVLPAIANFWRVDLYQSSKGMEERVDAAKDAFLEDQLLLARWLMLARRKALPEDDEEFKGPWSIEEAQEMQEARTREQEREGKEEDGDEEDYVYPDFDDEGDEDLIRGYSMDDAGWSVEESRDSEHRQKLNTAAIKVISRALPPQVPKSKSPAPIGLYELSVVERPPELDVPPPPDIFGGDTPAGIGKAGAGEVPALSGAADRTWRGKRRLSEESAWPEEGQEEGDGEGKPWGEGAGEEKLPRAREKDYQEVEDVLLKGMRVRRPPDDMEEEQATRERKEQLLRRAALVAELHPDTARQIELQMEEEGSRTVFVRRLPYGLSAYTVRDAFSRCGDVHQVIIKEPIFREGEDPVSRPNAGRKRAFRPSGQSELAFSTAHGLVVFSDHEGFDRATGESFRIFGVHIKGAAVATSPAHQCRTLFVENLEMRTGLEMVEAINEVLQPRYKVGLASQSLENNVPQVVAIPLRKYVAVRAVDKILTDAGFITAYHYIKPQVRQSHPSEDKLLDTGMPEQHIPDEVAALSEDGLMTGASGELGKGGISLEDVLPAHHR
ncbi:unnamed protein product [Ectocarpus sp. CCAP 1310/34]|nr:unnamed protein product [Ectocarpus sp. CCAP 1310/34]